MTSQAPTQPGERFLPDVKEVGRRLVENLETVVHGKSEEIRLVLSALVAGGHVLLEDVPGTAKTILARAIAASVEGVEFSRIQCTPDLQPTDATGLSVFDQEHRPFVFQPGPLFANVVLVDEINRAMPKTQSALLEAMAEHQITVDGITRQLPDPFLLIATENPIEYEGTFPLPEAQLDRFFLRATLGYPGARRSSRSSASSATGTRSTSWPPPSTEPSSSSCAEAAEDVYLDELLEEWIVGLVRKTRELDQVEVGASVRGSLALAKTARAWALLQDATTSCRRTSCVCSSRSSATGSCSGRRSSPRRGSVDAGGARAAARPRASSWCRRRARTGPSRPGLTYLSGIRRPQHLPARSQVPADGAAVRIGPEYAARPRQRPRGLPRLRSRRPDLDDRLARERAPLDRTRRRRVRRPRAVRRRGADGVRRRRSPAVDGGSTRTGRRGSRNRRSRRAASSIVASAVAARGAVGYLDLATRPTGRRALLDLPPGPLAARARSRRAAPAGFDAGRLARGVRPNVGRSDRSLGAGSFVFVVSDFLEPPPRVFWLRALARRLELVPVVIQDPTWEQSFPAVGPVVVPVVDPADGTVLEVRLGRSEARAERERRERARAELLVVAAASALDPVLLDRSDPDTVPRAFSRMGRASPAGSVAAAMRSGA